jgi:hypothetical protein
VINDVEDDSSMKENENQKEPEDKEREYLNMDEFYSKNVFLTEKKVENPTTHAEL